MSQVSSHLARIVSQTSVTDIDQFIDQLLAITRGAERAIMHYYSNLQREEVTLKADNSPVTIADYASHQLLSAALLRLTPNIAVLSEESVEADIGARLNWPVLWIVDPLDGINEFIGKTREFTINIALVSEGASRFGPAG